MLLVSNTVISQNNKNCGTYTWIDNIEAQRLPKKIDTIPVKLRISDIGKLSDTTSEVTPYYVRYYRNDSNCVKVTLKRYFITHIVDGYVVKTKVLKKYPISTSRGERIIEDTFISSFYPDIYLDSNKNVFVGKVVVWESL